MKLFNASIGTLIQYRPNGIEVWEGNDGVYRIYVGNVCLHKTRCKSDAISFQVVQP